MTAKSSIEAMSMTNRFFTVNDKSSSLNLRGSAANAVVSNPTVDVASVVANLKSAAVHCLNEVQVITASDFDKNDVAWLKRRRVARLKSHQVAIVDLATHRMAAWPYLDGLASL
jgi:hypothetical protein